MSISPSPTPSFFIYPNHPQRAQKKVRFAMTYLPRTPSNYRIADRLKGFLDIVKKGDIIGDVGRVYIWGGEVAYK